jgi:hypothetical protein
MSEQQSVKTEKPTWTYPGSRQTPTVYNNPDNLAWYIDVPAGKMPAGFTLDVKLTTVGAGMSLTRVSQIFKNIQVFGDGKLVGSLDQYTLDLVPITLGWARHNDDYADVDIGQLATGRYLVQDDVNVATGASMYGIWQINCAFPAAKQLKIAIQTYDMTKVFGAGMTGGVPSISVVPKWAPLGKRKQYKLFAQQLNSETKVNYRGVEIGAFFTTAEWNTITSSVKLGGELTVEQIYAIQSNVGNALSLWAQAIGSAVDGRLTTILDPLTAADVYVLANKFDGQAAAELSFLAPTTVKAIIMSETGPEKIEVE